VAGHDAPEVTTGAEEDGLTVDCELPELPVADVELVDDAPVADVPDAAEVWCADTRVALLAWVPL
jgi:hypothetical protein